MIVALLEISMSGTLIKLLLETSIDHQSKCSRICNNSILIIIQILLSRHKEVTIWPILVIILKNVITKKRISTV